MQETPPEATQPRPVLLLAGRTDLGGLPAALGVHGLTPLITPRVESASRILAQLPVVVAVFATDVAGWPSLLEDCRRRQVPTILVGAAAELAADRRADGVDLHLPEPVGVHPLASAIALAATLTGDDQEIRVGQLTIEVTAHRVTVDGTDLLLPPKEFELLAALARRPGRPVPTAELLRTIWSDEPGITSQDVHWHVWRLRQLLEGCDCGLSVVNRRGYGYLLDLPVAPR